MNPELATRLARLETDLRKSALDRAALFWLNVFAEQASGNGYVRSDHWVEHGLAAAEDVPGLDAANLSPRRDLITRYDLFRFVRLKDDAAFTGDALADLDWQRKYRVSLLPEFAWDLSELRIWAAERWSELGGVDPQFAALEAVLERYLALALPPRSYLLEILHDAQAIFGGWLPRPVVERVAAALNIPQAEVYGVTEFYEMFNTEPVGRKIVRVCQDASCGVAGADALLAGLCRHLNIRPGETTADGRTTVEAVRCLGLCDRAPAALVNHARYAPSDPAAPRMLLDGPPVIPKLRVGGLVKLALSNVGVVDATSLEEYRAQGGLAAMRKALHSMTPGQAMQAVKDSKLVGRGGAAFPTGLKWQFAADNPQPRFVICNADESEPGAFKDRVLMDGDPFRVVEGLMLACYAVEAERAFIYVRGEHRRGYERFSNAVQCLEQAGWLGDNIQGRGWRLHIEVRRGAGA
ncbi:MAG: NAD(P)H-dependent oxidoreductase subunit E, partial [Anaerolineae bacterium]|nr:NAD(P)H-dependent oxidoreductase subunit E [Anaerolineae bacterium]